MLTVHHAKSLQGRYSLPPSPDLFLAAAFSAIAAGRAVRIHPVKGSPAIRLWAQLLGSHAAVSWEENACLIDPGAGHTASAVIFADDAIPYRDLIVFSALGMRKTVVFGRVAGKRLAAWVDQAKRIGCALEITSDEGNQALRLSALPSPVIEPPRLKENDIHPFIGLHLGLRTKAVFRIECSLITPFRHLAEAMGITMEVHRDTGEKERDPLMRRMKIQAGRRLSSQNPLFTITTDFSAVPGSGPIDLLLPGDEVLYGLLVAGKSLIHRGSLVIDNAPLEPWASPMPALLRKMGGRPPQQPTHLTSFGETGMISFQKHDLTGQKTDCVPLYQYAFQLPAMAVLAAFAEGESIFRHLGDLRCSDPDGIAQIEACLKKIEVKLGSLPDGLVIKGGGNYDGFDVTERLPAPLAGACAMAGLHCQGSTTLNDELLSERWPGFEEMLTKLCEFRT